MGASALFLHRSTTMAAAVIHAVMLEMLTKGEDLVDDEESVAPIVSHDVGEDEIEQHAHTHKDGEVGGDTYNITLLAEIVDNGNEDEENAPHADEERHEDRSMAEGI